MLEQEVWLEKTPYLITGIEQLFYISYFIYIYILSLEFIGQFFIISILRLWHTEYILLLIEIRTRRLI